MALSVEEKQYDNDDAGKPDKDTLFRTHAYRLSLSRIHHRNPDSCSISAF